MHPRNPMSIWISIIQKSCHQQHVLALMRDQSSSACQISKTTCCISSVVFVECHVEHLSLERIRVHLFFFLVVNLSIECQYVCSISLCRLCACWLLMVDLQITGRLLVGMRKKLRPVELCSYTLGCESGHVLVCSIVHNNNNKARWGPVVFVMYV